MVNLDDPKQKFLVDSGYEYQGGGIWTHPRILNFNRKDLKEWTLHEAYMYEKYDVWVNP